MKIRLLSAVLVSLVAGTMLSSPILAQEDPGHPRINQVDGRVDTQENRVMKEGDNGQLTPGQVGRDEKRDAQINNQMKADEAKHGGHITKREQRKLNHELNKEHRKEKRQERKDKRREHHEHKAAAPAGAK